MISALNFGETVASGALNAVFTALFVAGAATWVIKRRESRETDRRRQEDIEQERLRREREEEFQTRAALRAAYALLLVAQRRSREAFVLLAKSASDDIKVDAAATQAYALFIDEYHRLALDASDDMWRELRRLRRILGAMKSSAQKRDAASCDELFELARDARQNLEGSFRKRLGYSPLVERNDLGKYDRLKDDEKSQDEN